MLGYSIPAKVEGLESTFRRRACQRFNESGEVYFGFLSVTTVEVEFAKPLTMPREFLYKVSYIGGTPSAAFQSETLKARGTILGKPMFQNRTDAHQIAPGKLDIL